MLPSTTSKLGLSREELAVALLSVRTGPESPKGNLSELMRDRNLNCGVERERELTWEKPKAKALPPPPRFPEKRTESIPKKS